MINQKRANHGSPPIVFHDNPTWTNRTASWACDEVKNTNLAKNPALLPDQQLFFSDNYINAQTLSDSFCSCKKFRCFLFHLNNSKKKKTFL